MYFASLSDQQISLAYQDFKNNAQVYASNQAEYQFFY